MINLNNDGLDAVNFMFLIFLIFLIVILIVLVTLYVHNNTFHKFTDFSHILDPDYTRHFGNSLET